MMVAVDCLEEDEVPLLLVEWLFKGGGGCCC